MHFLADVTEVAPPESVVAALILQTSLGFALTGVSIPVTIWLADTVGWRVACGVLAFGPVLGIVAMARRRALPKGA